MVQLWWVWSRIRPGDVLNPKHKGTLGDGMFRIQKHREVMAVVAPRIEPLEPPFEPGVDEQLRSMMPGGVPPIALFRTFVRNPRMTAAMLPWGRHQLSRSLSVGLREREIVIMRTCARCGCEYEWGVHLAFFGERAGFERVHVTSLTHGGPEDVCWTEQRDRVLIRLVDELHEGSEVGDPLWRELREQFAEDQMLDLLMLCGWYHAISFTARAARVPLEDGAPTFASVR